MSSGALLLAAVLAGQLDAVALGRAVAAHRGRPVVLTLWATWCEPCVKEFPALAALARERKDVAFLSVSIDEPEGRKALQAFVAERRPPFPVYVRAPGPDQDFIDGVDREWSGVVPATLVYDREGRRVALLQGEHTRADIEKALARIKAARGAGS
ncbi:MAG TPA: TlpA disulfide reductase family protein [Vicinamibacteria bacterium]